MNETQGITADLQFIAVLNFIITFHSNLLTPFPYKSVLGIYNILKIILYIVAPSISCYAFFSHKDQIKQIIM